MEKPNRLRVSAHTAHNTYRYGMAYCIPIKFSSWNLDLQDGDTAALVADVNELPVQQIPLVPELAAQPLERC